MKTVVMIVSTLIVVSLFFLIHSIPNEKGSDVGKEVINLVLGIFFGFWINYVENSKWTEIKIK